MVQSFPPEQRDSWTEQAKDLGRRAVDRGAEATAATRDTIAGHPAATLAIVGGVAFLVGALWMMKRSRPAHTSLLDRLAGLQAELPRRWRM